MAHVRKYQLGQHSAISQKILNELAAAKACLLNRDKKTAYDAAIEAKSSTANSFTGLVEPPLPPPAPIQSPAIAENRKLPEENAAGIAKTTYLFGRKGFRQPNKKWGLSIGLGSAVALGGVLVTIFLIGGNNQDSAISNSKNQTAINIDDVEIKSPNQRTQSNTSGNSEPVKHVGSEFVPAAPPNDDRSTTVDNHNSTAENRSQAIPSTVTTDLKPDLIEKPKANERSQQSETPNPDLKESDSRQSIPPIDRIHDPLDDIQKGKTNEIGLPQQKPAARLSGLIPTPPKTKGKSGAKIKSGLSSSFMPSPISLNLPSGKIFNSQFFDVDVKSVEDTLKDKVKNLKIAENYMGQVIDLPSPSTGAHAWFENDKGKLDGVYLAFSNDNTPNIYAKYLDGVRNGIFIKWDENGDRVYWCQYTKGIRHGFCCFFQDNILRILFEINRNAIKAVHLCKNNELIKSFESPEEAAADEGRQNFD